MSAAAAFVSIDGSHLEGAGALLRSALTMSVLTQQPVEITNIRGGSRFPGLDAEDITLVKALAASSSAVLEGNELGSNTLRFAPVTRAKNMNGDLLTVRNEAGRGPNALVIVSSLAPILARTGAYSSIALEGETYGVHSLSFDYFANVTVPALRSLGLYMFPVLDRAGFGRESGGKVTIDFEPSSLTGVDLSTRGSLRSVNALVVSSGLSPTIATRIQAHLKSLARSANLDLECDKLIVDADQTGVFVTTWATYENGFGGSAVMGARGVRSEAVAQSAFEELFDFMSSDATLDPFVADQFLIPACLAEGTTQFKVSRLTRRLLTTAWVIKQFTPIHITIKGLENGPGSITIQR